MENRMRILFFPGSYSTPNARYRVWQFAPHLESLGHQVEVRVVLPERTWKSTLSQRSLRLAQSKLASLFRLTYAIWMTRDIHQFDVVLMNRDLIPEVGIDWLEPWLARRNPRLIFDFDDAIFVGPRDGKLRKILPRFAWVTAGNAYLAEYARQHNANVSILPTVVDTGKFRPAAERAPGPLRVGWSGSRSTLEHCLPLLEGVITRLSREEDFEFVVIAEVAPEIRWTGVKVCYIPWTAQSEVEGLQQIDIGLMPLRDEAFERGKCGLKAIQYMGVGIPALVSPVGVNREIVVDGETGFHCNTDEEWVEKIRFLLHNDEIRRQMGLAGARRIADTYSLSAILPELISIFNKINA